MQKESAPRVFMEDSGIPAPYCTRHHAYTTEEAAGILRGISRENPHVCSSPPVKPKGGDVFLYEAEGEEYKGMSYIAR